MSDIAIGVTKDGKKMVAKMSGVENRYYCPLCLTEETVKGWKVCDSKNRWWHKCWGDHSEFNNVLPEGYTVNDELMYFHWVSENKCLVETDDGTNVMLEWVED